MGARLPETSDRVSVSKAPSNQKAQPGGAARPTSGPDGLCSPQCYSVRFGALAMPSGYSVWWHEETEHYQGHGPGGAESDVHADRFASRRWCVEHAAGGAS